MNMTEEVQNLNKKITSAFEKTLNRHGYGFQYSVLKKAKQLFEDGRSPWIFEPSEFPVSVQGRDVHIDFILRWYRKGMTLAEYSIPVYLVAECKRADPALKYWCFARAPYVS